MFDAVALTYGMVTGFVLSCASLNVRLRRPHPPVMIHLGYLLCGISVGVAALAGAAALGLVDPF